MASVCRTHRNAMHSLAQDYDKSFSSIYELFFHLFFLDPFLEEVIELRREGPLYPWAARSAKQRGILSDFPNHRTITTFPFWDCLHRTVLHFFSDHSSWVGSWEFWYSFSVYVVYLVKSKFLCIGSLYKNNKLSDLRCLILLRSSSEEISHCFRHFGPTSEPPLLAKAGPLERLDPFSFTSAAKFTSATRN